MYESTVVVRNDIEDIEKLFIPEQRELGRSSYTIQKSKNELIFMIKAEDGTAFKTVMNTLAKIFITWEKTKELTKNN